MSLAHSFALAIVPIDRVLPHERHDPRRVADLARRLAADGKLINPPIAARLSDQYVILDGATRLAAFQCLGYPYIILQTVDPQTQSVQLHVWQHLLRDGSSEQLLQILADLPDVALTPASGTVSEPLPAQALGRLLTPVGESFLLQPAAAVSEQDWLRLLNRLVDAYSAWGKVERILITDLNSLHVQYPGWAGLMNLPRFTLDAILDMASQGHTIPAGITRFLIPGRILRLNAPLDMLTADEPLEVKQRRLDQFLAAKLADRQVRYYEEPVLLLDE